MKRIVALVLAVMLVLSFGGICAFASAEDDGLDEDALAEWQHYRDEMLELLRQEAEESPEEEDPADSDVALLDTDEDLLEEVYGIFSEEDVAEGAEPQPVRIWAESLSDGEVAVGSMICFYSELTGFEDVNALSLQWQTSADEEEWVDVEGATGATLIITIDDSNADSFWRLVVRA